MSFDIYKEEEHSDSKKKPKTKAEPLKNHSQMEIKPFYIHLAVIIILLIAFIIFLAYDFNISFDRQSNNEIYIMGTLQTFSKEVQGNVSLEAQNFKLQTNAGTFDEEKKTEFNIENFQGRLFLENSSLIFQGTANRISFGRNTLNLNGQEFTLTTTRETSIGIFFPTLEINPENGVVRLSQDLTYRFEKVSVELTNFEATMTYNRNIFTFEGEAELLSLTDEAKGITIEYTPEKVN